jgi:hypothetical protein
MSIRAMSAIVGGLIQERRLAMTGLLLGPVLLVVGLAIGMQPSLIGSVLPIETAWIQGAIALPLLVLAPGVLSLAWSDEGVEAAGKWLSRGIALAIFVWVTGWVALNVTYIACQPITDPLQAVPRGAAWGAIAGLGFLAATAAGSWSASSGRPRAAVVAAAVVGALALFAVLIASFVLFPVLSCARGPI